MTHKKVLTFDFGASSGRAMLSHINDGKLVLEEIHRFPNNPITEGGNLVWDFEQLAFEFQHGMQISCKDNNVVAIGCNSWGVDFGLLDKNGDLLSFPIHYRDERTNGIPEELYSIVSREELFFRTGVQPYQYNTIFQLYYLMTRKCEELMKADKFLMIANLFAHTLTGELAIEESLASTTGLMNLNSMDWDYDLIEALHIPYHLFPKIVRAGSKHKIVNFEGKTDLQYINIATHDTASAVMVCDTQSTFISCGTWSLLGKKTSFPILSKLALEMGYSNEIGYKGEYLFLKNLTGLWIIQELAREWKISFQTIMDMARLVNDPEIYVDTQDDSLFSPVSMNKAIDALLGYEERNIGKKARIVYESLAKKHAKEITILDEITSTKTLCIEIVGGGVKADLLLELIEKWTNLPVKAGPVEATTVGGALAKLAEIGEIDLEKAKTSDFV